ncbi:unnamed protein product [Fusarium graminearum]|nr:unnamed protein product [Fusarium graminearum]
MPSGRMLDVRMRELSLGFETIAVLQTNTQLQHYNNYTTAKMCLPFFRKKKQPMVYDYYPQPVMGYSNKYDKHGYSKKYNSKKYKKQRKYDHMGSAVGNAAGIWADGWGGSGGDGGGGGSGGCDGGGGGGGAC